MRERAPDLHDQIDARAEVELRVRREVVVETLAAVEGLEEHGGPRLGVRHVVEAREDPAVIAQPLEQARLAVGRALEELAALDGRLLRHEVRARAPPERGLLLVLREAVLVAGPVHEQVLEDVRAGHALVVPRPEADRLERAPDVLSGGGAVEALAGEHAARVIAVRQGTRDLGARDDALPPVVRQPDRQPGLGQHDQRLDARPPRSAVLTRSEEPVEARGEDARLQVRGDARVVEAPATPAG